MLALVAGCSGSPATAYVDAVAGTTEQMTRDTFTALPPGAAPTREAVTGVVAARRRALETIAALDAPDDLLPEHLALVQTLTGFVEGSEAFLQATGDLDAAAFAAALRSSTALDDLAAAMGSACTAWERRAAEVSHTVELGC